MTRIGELAGGAILIAMFIVVSVLFGLIKLATFGMVNWIDKPIIEA